MKFNFGKLLLIFTVIPFIELSILLELAARTSALTTLALIIITGIVGAYFAKDQGRRVLTAIQAELNTGRMPAGELLHGLCVLIGGILLLTPGILTDLFGFSLLFPATRTLYIEAMKKYMKGHFNLSGVSMHSGGASNYQYYD